MIRHTLTLLLIILTTTLSAQPPVGGGGGGARGERGGNRAGNMHTMQCNQIITILELDDSKQAKFREIYTAYNEDIKALRAPRQERPEGEPTEEQIEASILKSFDTSIKSMEIKREYYLKFREILDPSQISKMYRVERNIRDRAIEELQHRGRNDGNEGGNRPTPPRFQ